MKLSTKGRYGVRAMLDLAIYATNSHIALKSVAERQNVSELYLEQLMSTLRKAGLVKSVRGAQGGYSLAYEPEKITIGMILRVLEGSLSPVECIDDVQQCDRTYSCVTRQVWQKLYEAINETVDSFTLKDLVDSFYAMREGQREPMYFI